MACCGKPKCSCICPPGPRGPQGPPGPGGLLAVVQLDEDLPAAFVSPFTTIISATVITTTGKLAMWATLGVDIFPVVPNTDGQARFRIIVDGGPTVASVEVTAVDPAHDFSVAVGGSKTVTPNVPHLVELQWMSTVNSPTLACEPLAEPDDEHATLFVAEAPAPVP